MKSVVREFIHGGGETPPADSKANDGLSVKTIETYKARIMEKLGLRSRVELVRYAMQHGLLSEDSPDG